MKEYLNNYIFRITALSPIHIGSGESIGKKEYIYNSNDGTVIIPDLKKMFESISKKGKENEYIKYMSNNKGYPLGNFLKENGFSFSDYEKWKLYKMEGGEILSKSGKNVPKDINCFVKEPYGQPYIPGSTIKGIIRTALLIYEFQNNPEKFEHIKREIYNKSTNKLNRNIYLKNEITNMEIEAFHTLDREEKTQNAVNCNLSGLIVSDSKPISTDNLILVQKIDKKEDGSENSLPIMRESIRPGTKVECSISIDADICPYTVQDIIRALNNYRKICDYYFNNRFFPESDEKNIIWIGGGTGFVSKTITYALFKNEGLKVTDTIFKQTISAYKKHMHDRDIRQYKIAPHVAKCTRYDGRIYDMGRAKFQFFRRTR